MIVVIAAYIFIGLVLTEETIRTMEAENPEEMMENYRNLFWWIGPILVTVGWPLIFVWAWLDNGEETA